MSIQKTKFDVLCVGQASYDLIFSINHHPQEDEKLLAQDLLSCGGGPAANAAVTVARLGYTAAFAGFLGQDIYGDKHYCEFLDEGVDTQFIIRGQSPTPLSTVLVKPDGKRTLINFKGNTKTLAANAIDFSNMQTTVMLFDGHEPKLSMPLAEYARSHHIATVLDAGSVHEGTLALMNNIDYLVCSEKFAQQFAGDNNTALTKLTKLAPVVVITLGENGLIWQRGLERGSFQAFTINAIDTTGAGDAFHGAFALAVALKLEWLAILRFASAAGALCCTQMGARYGIPLKEAHGLLYDNPS